MTPILIDIPWHDPLDASHGLLTQPETGTSFRLVLVGRGSHPLARWSYLCGAPVAVRRWQAGDPGGPLDGLEARLQAAGVQLHPDGPPFQGGWAGLASYELGGAFERLPRPPADVAWHELLLGLVDTVAAFDIVERRALVLSVGLDADGRPDPLLAAARAQHLADAIARTRPIARPGPPAGARLDPVQDSASVKAAVARTVAWTHAGDIYQANISRRLSGCLPEGAGPADLFHALMSRHPAPFGACLVAGDLALVSHTPERFVTCRADGTVETRPIKGTRPLQADPAADAAEADQLRASVKDRAENLMIVDLMRNDLARVCEPGSVKVPRLFALESFSTVHHLVSDITGRLRPERSAFDLLAATFPPGSVTGAPKVRAMQIIAELEQEARGPYCGAMLWAGWDGALDSSVLIRTAALVRQDSGSWRLDVRAGGGIVADSDPSAEHAEMQVKARAFVETLARMAAAP